MRLTPAQIAVHHICGQELPLDGDLSLIQRIRYGHDFLVRITGQDFGYDLQGWHDYLSNTRDGGYTWNSSIKTPKIMVAALANPDWIAAVEAKTNLLESEWLRYSFCEKSVFIERLMQKKFAKYFQLNYTGDKLKIETTMPYEKIYHAIN